MADDRSNPRNWLGQYADADTGWLALRAAERPAYLASALAEYLDVREWTPEQLAQYLRCAPQQLAKLGLCRRPDLGSPEFHQQVSQIVTGFQLDYWGLRRLLEELALEPQQRRQVWTTADFLEQARRSTTGARASGDFTGVFGAQTDHAMSPPQAHQGESSWDHAPASISPETLPQAVPTRRPSWFRRLLSVFRKFFSKK